MTKENTIYNMDCQNCHFIEDGSTQLIFTSPPYADMRVYGDFVGIKPDNYVDWFIPKAEQFLRILKDDGSFILNINDKVVDGFRSTYFFRLVIALEKIGFKLWDRFIWYKKNPMPGMGGKRFRDGTEYIFWFSKNKPYVDIASVKKPKKDNKNRESVLYSKSRGGHDMKKRETSERYPELVVPINVLEVNLGVVTKGSHPATFPRQLPEFFILSASKPDDLVIDPFCGSGTTLLVAKELSRKFVGFEINSEYAQYASNRVGCGLEKFL